MGSSAKRPAKAAKIQFHTLGDNPRDFEAKTLGDVVDHFNIKGVKTLVNGKEISDPTYPLKDGYSVIAVPNIKHG